MGKAWVEMAEYAEAMRVLGHVLEVEGNGYHRAEGCDECDRGRAMVGAWEVRKD